jgi:hypothetical protein
MREEFEDTLGENGDAISGSLAATVNYRSPSFYGVSFQGQYIHALELFEGGTIDFPSEEAHFLSNSRFSILNEAFVEFSLAELGAPDTMLRIGRQIPNYDFAPAYDVRQKAQSFEAIIFSSRPTSWLNIDLGHVDSFSSWSSRREAVEFQKIAEVLGVPYGTAGMQFISVTGEPIRGARATLYDWHAHDLFNTFGAKLDLTLSAGQTGSSVLQAHYMGQRDVGRMDDDGFGEIEADVLDLGVEFKKGALALKPGVTVAFGDGPENDLLLPFRSTLTIDTEVIWFTRQFQGGSRSAYLRATYAFGNTVLYGMYVLTDHDQDRGPVTGNGALDQELDLALTHNFTNHLYLSLVAGYGFQNNHDGLENSSANDVRLFIGYAF